MPRAVSGGAAKDITTGTIITVLFLAVTSYLPLIGFFCALFVPLPTLFYRTKLGRKLGLAVPAAAFFIMTALLGGISMDHAFFLELLLLGFVLGEFLSMDLSVDKTVVYACATVLLCALAGVLLYANISGKSIGSLVSAYIAENLKLTMSLYESMGVPEEALVNLSNSLDKIQWVLVRIIPAMVVCSTLFVAWVNVLLARAVMVQKGIFFPNFGALNRWKAPDPLIWVLICCGGLLMVPAVGIKMIGLNGLLILLTVYFMQGIAVVSYYFEKKRFPKGLRLFLYSLIALQQIFLLLIIGLGVFDMWLNFRKLNSENNV
ncbi:MAG: YybS family protein [Deltaproteobacteria bacterium]|nr:YybS family protein [Deltaproteobacteria bacterium]